MLAVGAIVAISSGESIFILAKGIIDAIKTGAPVVTEKPWPIALIDIIILLLPVLTSIPWFALGLAGVSASILHKTARKAVRYSFGALTIAFGLIASGMFVISCIGNALPALQEIISILFYESIGFNACALAPVFILANVIGFIGIIMLTVYLIWPYKKKYHPEETDPEIIYAIEENDPVMCEIGGTTAEEKATEDEKGDAPEVEAADASAQSDSSENVENPPEKKKKCLFGKLKELAATRSRRFVTSYILIIIALFLEFSAVVPFIGIVSLIVMPKMKSKTTMIIFGILNMVFGGGIFSLAAGVLMIFSPERALLKAGEKLPEEENAAAPTEETEEAAVAVEETEEAVTV